MERKSMSYLEQNGANSDSAAPDYSGIVLPNVRKVFIPDPGYVLYDADLKGADAQVVAWESDDDDLKAAFRSGIDVHEKNAEDLWGSSFTRLTGHSRDAKRQETKKAVHLSNYGGSARTAAISLGWTIREAEHFQSRWFSIHPRIKSNFHNRINSLLHSNRTITNAFGFRRIFYDRIDSCFAEALAWIPQSTVALNSYIGLLQLEERFFPDPHSVEGLLLQTHDSGTFQFRRDTEPHVEVIRDTLRVLTPYPDPLVIPWDIKRSERSWGELEKI
jgi:DNA polymerase I-like protein with 3'-5' exonuclease and polymerase domains